MKQIYSLVFFLTFVCSLNAIATIYVGFSDPQSGEKALAVITSGPITSDGTIISAQKNKGLIGWSGGGRVSAKADQAIFQMMSEGQKASAIESKIEEMYPNQYYRLLFVTPEGEVGSLIPKNGCPELECGKKETSDFVIIGGGLEAQVLEKAFDEFQKISTQTEKSTACKMLEILSYISSVGGEKKQFTSGQIVIETSTSTKLIRANSFKAFLSNSEKAILQRLNSDLSDKGIYCLL